MENNHKITISDPTLRDGNHAVGHQLSAEQIAAYCRAADIAGVSIVEVGHGNGLGASSLQLGESKTPDHIALETARENLTTSKLGIHVIPGFATIERDLKPALELGVDVVRVAAHCSEADICERHISFSRSQGVEVWGCLMMSHMISPALLLEQARKMESYGAEGVGALPGTRRWCHVAVHDRPRNRRIRGSRISNVAAQGFPAFYEKGYAAIRRSPSQSVRNPTAWFQLSVVGRSRFTLEQRRCSPRPLPHTGTKPTH